MSKKRVLFHVYYVTLILLGLIVFGQFAGYDLFGRNANDAARPAVEATEEDAARKLEVEREKQRINEVLKSSSSRMAEDVQQWADGSDMLFKKWKTRLNECVARIAADTATFGNCVDIVYYLAVDKCFDGNRAEDFIRGKIEPQINPELKAFAAEVNNELRKLDEIVATSSRNVSKQLLAVSLANRTKFGKIRASSLKQLEMGATLDVLKVDGLSIGIQVAFEAYAFVGSAFAWRLWSIATQMGARIFSRQVGRMAAVAIAPAADGPLPIGDALAVIGLYFIKCDIENSLAEFEINLKSDLAEAIEEKHEEMENSLMQAASTRARAWSEFMASMHP